MLNIFSWLSFFRLLIPIIIVYYTYILSVYFRQDILFMLKGEGKVNDGKTARKTSGTAVASNKNEKESGSFSIVHELLEELKEFLLKAEKNKTGKEELITGLKNILRSYPKFAETDLKEDLNQHLLLEVKEICGFDFLPEDLKQCWLS